MKSLANSNGKSEVLAVILMCLAGVVAFLGLIWVIQGNDFFLYKTFAPKYEQVRRETFEQTKSYNQGMVQNLQKMQFEYLQATPEKQETLAPIILATVADYDAKKLPPDLYAFVQGLRRERGLAR